MKSFEVVVDSFELVMPKRAGCAVGWTVGTTVRVGGEEISGVQRVSIDISANNLARLTIEGILLSSASRPSVTVQENNLTSFRREFTGSFRITGNIIEITPEPV